MVAHTIPIINYFKLKVYECISKSRLSKVTGNGNWK